MTIQQIRSATLKITYGGITFLLDPWLEDQGAGRAAPAVRADMQGKRAPLDALPFPPDEVLAGVDHLLVSHIHPDHFTPHYLPKNISILTQNQTDAQTVADMGFEQVTAFQDDRLTLGSVELTRVDGIHGDNPQLAEKMGTVSGFVLRHPSEKTLYLCGDTVWCDSVRETVDRETPDVIAVNCCAATLPFGRLLMDDKELAQLAQLAPQSHIIATHFGSINHALITREEIKQFVRESGLSNVLVPENGETLTF